MATDQPSNATDGVTIERLAEMAMGIQTKLCADHIVSAEIKELAVIVRLLADAAVQSNEAICITQAAVVELQQRQPQTINVNYGK